MKKSNGVSKKMKSILFWMLCAVMLVLGTTVVSAESGDTVTVRFQNSRGAVLEEKQLHPGETLTCRRRR